MNCLKINPTKTELMYIANRWQIRKCAENSIRVGAHRVERSAQVKLLGTWLDEHLSFKYHLMQMCKNTMLSSYKIRNLRRYLSMKACQVLIHSLVFFHTWIIAIVFYMDYQSVLLENYKGYRTLQQNYYSI